MQPYCSTLLSCLHLCLLLLCLPNEEPYISVSLWHTNEERTLSRFTGPSDELLFDWRFHSPTRTATPKTQKSVDAVLADERSWLTDGSTQPTSLADLSRSNSRREKGNGDAFGQCLATDAEARREARRGTCGARNRRQTMTRVRVGLPRGRAHTLTRAKMRNSACIARSARVFRLGDCDRER